MRLADPIFLLFFLLFPLAAIMHRQAGGRIQYSSLSLFSFLSTKPSGRRRILNFLRFTSLALIVLALSRPQSGKKFSEVMSDGVDIFLAIDTSGSMQAMDFKNEGQPVDRLSVIKKVVNEFILNRPNDRLGLIVFGSEAFTQCPLTLDHGILLEFLKKMEIGMVGDATAIGSAIGTAAKRMKGMSAKSKVLILLTDGESNAGEISPLVAAEIAKKYGIKIYTIGVGTNGMVPILQNTVFGKRYVYAEFPIDEKTLTEIASKTGGHYYRAKDTEELQKIYAEIDRLEKTQVEVKEYTEYQELFVYFLFAALVLTLGEVILAQTILRKIP